MKRPPHRPIGRCFTLVELAVVVGIVAILAAIAIPVMSEMSLKAKQVEIKVVREGIVSALMASQSVTEGGHWNTGSGSGCPSYDPDLTPNKNARPWVDCESWSEIGFAPDGEVRCSYRGWFGPMTPYTGGWSRSFSVNSLCDLDGDGIVHFQSYTVLADISEVHIGGSCDGFAYAYSTPSGTMTMYSPGTSYPGVKCY